MEIKKSTSGITATKLETSVPTSKITRYNVSLKRGLILSKHTFDQVYKPLLE